MNKKNIWKKNRFFIDFGMNINIQQFLFELIMAQTPTLKIKYSVSFKLCKIEFTYIWHFCRNIIFCKDLRRLDIYELFSFETKNLLLIELKQSFLWKLKISLLRPPHDTVYPEIFQAKITQLTQTKKLLLMTFCDTT